MPGSALILGVLLAAAPAVGQETTRDREAAAAQAEAPATPPDAAELERRIEALAAEVNDLKLGEVAKKLESRYGLGPAASKVYGVERGFSFGGYGEAVYANFDTEREDGIASGEPDRVDFLRQILYIGYKYDAHILLNAEIEFEHATSDKNGEVSVEFATVDFMLDPAINGRAGLLLVPMGWINELHEPPVFLGANRPVVEQTIVPTTWRANGAGIFGQPSGRFDGLQYRAYLIESLASVGETGEFTAEGLADGRQLGSEALMQDAAGVVRADYERRGITAGGSVFFGNTSQDATFAGPSGQEKFGGFTTVYEGHVQLRHRGLQLRGLVAGASVDDAAAINQVNDFTGTQSVGSRLQGWYVEAGWDVLRAWRPGSRFALVPFARYEALDTQAEVPETPASITPSYAADPAHDQQIVTAGVAFYPHAQVVFKADHEFRRNEADTGVDRWNLALGYLF